MAKTRKRIKAARLLPLVALAILAGCDTDWKERAQRAYLAGIEQADQGYFEAALPFYQRALKLNPYHPGANYRLASLYETRLFVREHADQKAVFYYRRYLDLRPANRDNAESARKRIALLGQLISGALEDPAYATNDFLAGAGEKSLREFSARLHHEFIAALIREYKSTQAVNKYMERWHALADAKPRFAYRNIYRRDNDYRALVLVEFKESAEARKLTFALNTDGLWELVSDRPARDN